MSETVSEIYDMCY